MGVGAQWALWRDRLHWAGAVPDPPLPQLKVFKSKFGLPRLNNYREAAPAEFWTVFPVNKDREGGPLLNADKLEGLALTLGVTDPVMLELVCNDLRGGADIGCRGRYREKSVSKNAPSAYEYPEEVTDAVAGWVHNEFALGPMTAAEVPPGAKINGIMCRPKPNGSARVILNLSAPKGRSVNDGIDLEEFPATMASTKKWLAVLEKAGRGAVMSKLDWSDAYKHIRVRAEDVELQYFEWLGMFFAELCLVFGAVSSVGIYDRAAKLVLDLVLRMAGTPRDMVCQYLDDVCAAAPAGSQDLAKFENAYRRVAEEVGVKLAPTDDPDKAFSAATCGVVLGVEYDTVSWCWRIPEVKKARLVGQLTRVAGGENVLREEIWSLTGRILHYAPLIPCGRFNLEYILAANAVEGGPRDVVKIPVELKRQLGFWRLLVLATDGMCKIPKVRGVMPAWTVEIFTDAAGGSTESAGRGSGGVSGDWWYYVPWPRKINTGVKAADGKKLSRKLSALELVGPLIAVAAGADRCSGQPVRVWVDNAGSVAIWKKGYSMRCQLCNTLVKAAARVAAAIGCRLTVEKIRRCSAAGASMADALSKAQFGKCREIGRMDGWHLSSAPAQIPHTVLRWLANPVKDDELGDRILQELSSSRSILGVNWPPGC